MSLKYIIDRVSSIMGFDIDLNPDQRTLLLQYINEAADEVYSEKDLPISLKEVFIKATNSARLALPPFIGELRGLRSQRCNDRWSLLDIRPRYAQVDWSTKVDKVRVIGEAAIATEITNAAAITLQYQEVDTELITSIVGETTESNRAIDNITQTATSVTGTKNFTEINKIRKNKITDYNLLVKDANDNEIAVIYADQLDSRYIIVDISAYPALVDCVESGQFLMEILYKPRRPVLENDEDEFPVQGWDDIIVLRTKQLITEDIPGQEQRAILQNQKSKQKIDDKINDKSQATQKRIQTTRNPFFSMFRRYRYGRSTPWPSDGGSY